MLGRALKQLRIFHGLRQTEMADRLGISNAYLSQIESEQRTNVSIELVNKYAEIFDLYPHDVVRFSDELSEKEGVKRNSSAADRALKILEWISDEKKASS